MASLNPNASGFASYISHLCMALLCARFARTAGTALLVWWLGKYAVKRRNPMCVQVAIITSSLVRPTKMMTLQNEDIFTTCNFGSGGITHRFSAAAASGHFLT
jgi:hypothetical protein